jgi:uncharacterized protein
MRSAMPGLKTVAKFHALDHFKKDIQSYELLPFRFARIDGRVVLTNFAGEHYLCSSETFQDFTSGKLIAGSEHYNKLRSRHFLADEQTQIGKKLLAIKYRTRISRIADFTSLHLFVVSLRCEHSCPYCQVSRQSEDKLAFDMSQDIASNAIDFALSGPSPRMKFEFQGGESLLNFDLIKYIVEEAKKRNEILRKDLSFIIATNLAVVSDEILDFCKLHTIDISTSLDGPSEIHDSNRPRPGKNSHELTISGIQKARLKLGFHSVSALMTTTEKSLPNVTAIIDEYLNHEFSGIFLRPLSPYGFAVKTKRYNAYDEARWFEFYREGLEYILQINKAGIPFQEFYSATILKKILTFSDPGYVDLRSPAGIGIGAIVYNYDGKIFASDEGRMLAEMGDRTFEIGDLAKDNFRSVFTNEKLLDPIEKSIALSAPRCNDCAYEQYCGAEPVFHHATAGDFLGRKAESAFCHRNMSTFEYLIQKYEDDPEARKIFESWIN